MKRYLISTVETYRVETEAEAQKLIDEAKADRSFELKKYTSVRKERKMKGEVVDEWSQVSLTKCFTDEKEPYAMTEITYNISLGQFPSTEEDED